MEQLHLVSDYFIYNYFNHEGWWLHTALHWIVIGVPLTLFYLFVINIKALMPQLKLLAIRGKKDTHFLTQSITNYIISNTKITQVKLVLLSTLILPVVYGTLEIPKNIINQALGSDNVSLSLFNIDLSQFEFLIALCLAYLSLILLQAYLKYQLNLSKGLLAEHQLKILRIKTLNIWRKRNYSVTENAKIIPVIVKELEAISGFCGDIFVLPFFQGGTFLTILLFLFVQDPLLGTAAISLLPIQLIIIPKLQRKINALNQKRVIKLRHLGALIGRGGKEDKLNIEMTEAAITNLEGIRKNIYRRKFFMKAIYNITTHLTPFFFYTIGGYLVIEGNLTFGALIAALAAHKDFSAPLREVFKYYQTSEDVKVRWLELQKLLKPVKVIV